MRKTKNTLAEVSEAVRNLRKMLNPCHLCPRLCWVNRPGGILGHCGIGLVPRVSAAMPHFGEETVLVGQGGSGTIFFSGCNLHCVFCQNHDISQSDPGFEAGPKVIAKLGVNLSQTGCENINFVTPTHVSFAVAEAILLMRAEGVTVPTVYNCGGYESVDALEQLEGLIEIYMPDFKYADEEAGLKYSKVADYPYVATEALKEMYRQVGPLVLDERGVACKGLLVRHLVLPQDAAQSRGVIERVAEAAPGAAMHVMGQYRPAHRAEDFAELRGYPLAQEVKSLRDYASERGLVLVS